MAAPTIHYRIASGDLSVFADQVSYPNKQEAEDAAAALVVTSGGPSKLYIYALAAQVCVGTTAEDAI